MIQLTDFIYRLVVRLGFGVVHVLDLLSHGFLKDLDLVESSISTLFEAGSLASDLSLLSS